MNDQKKGVTALGAVVSALLVVGLIALGVYMIRRHAEPASSASAGTAQKSNPGAVDVAEVKVEVPRLSPPGTVQISNNVIPIEISEYAGYAGLIAANGGLEPSENSVFFKNHGVKVKLTISEGENWSALNEGKIAASVTT